MATTIKIDMGKVMDGFLATMAKPATPRRVEVDGCRFLVVGESVRPLAVRPGMSDAEIANATARAARAA